MCPCMGQQTAPTQHKEGAYLGIHLHDVAEVCLAVFPRLADIGRVENAAADALRHLRDVRMLHRDADLFGSVSGAIARSGKARRVAHQEDGSVVGGHVASEEAEVSVMDGPRQRIALVYDLEGGLVVDILHNAVVQRSVVVLHLLLLRLVPQQLEDCAWVVVDHAPRSHALDRGTTVLTDVAAVHRGR